MNFFPTLHKKHTAQAPKRTLLTTLSIVSVLAASLLLNACNTMAGMGRDFRRLGEGVENTAEGKTWTGQQRRATTPSATYSPTYQPPGSY